MQDPRLARCAHALAGAAVGRVEYIAYDSCVNKVVYQATQAYIKERLIVLQYPWVTTAREPRLGPPPLCLMGFPESSVMRKEDGCAP